MENGEVESTDGQERYCPECYFETDRVVLRENCPGHGEIGMDMTVGVTTWPLQLAEIVDDGVNVTEYFDPLRNILGVCMRCNAKPEEPHTKKCQRLSRVAPMPSPRNP